MKNNVLKVFFGIPILISLLLILGGCQLSSSSPSARHGAKMIYDPVGKQVILFGGRGKSEIGGDLLNDIWAFDLEKEKWREIEISTQPPSRLSPGFVYDPSHHQVILFGGYSSRGRLDDTWLLDLNDYQWKEIHPDLSPPARSDPGMAYDGSNQIVLLFGGYCLENQRDQCDDTWVFEPESNRWIDMNPSSSPPVMYGHSLNYDSLNGQFLVWGGHMSTFDQGEMASAGYNDSIWSYTYFDNHWQEIPPGNQSHPSARYWHQAVYDSKLPGLFVFGGDGGFRYLADTWFFDTETTRWSKHQSAQTPPGRIVGTAVYCPDYDLVMLFGGLRQDFSNLADTWIYSGNSGEWEQKSP
jgi:N-acetylneuraminic acid mutarotase